MDQKGNPKSIKLPEAVEAFGNLKNAKRFAIDIGGTLTKIAYYSTVSYRRMNYDTDQDFGNEKDNMKYEFNESARLHFVKFETKYIESCLDFISENLVAKKEVMIGKTIKATGGGAYRYAELLQEKLGLSVEKEDEMGCLIKGCNFLLKNISDEAFVYHRHGQPEYEFQKANPNIFPYLLVNIGSGVSIMKVESENSYERIGGTATGGGTFWGLGSLLTKAKGFDQLLALAESGDHRQVDMLVKDIYGGDYKVLGLPADLIASSFGKVCPKRGTDIECCDADVARSLLLTISNDIGQIACLYAMMHNLEKVYFGGYFLRNHPLTMYTISFAINYWSKGSVQSLFLRHEGYLGAIGAFMKGTEESDDGKYSWSENYAGSSGLHSSLPTAVCLESTDSRVLIDQLEMDRLESLLTFCPLLDDPANYVPDTVDLNGDEEARTYWLKCFEESLSKFVDKAISSQPNSITAKERAQQFHDKYINRLHRLQLQPFAYGNLTVRSLLDTIEHCLKEFDFPDPFLEQKKIENEFALSLLKERLEELDAIDHDERHTDLITSVLAGNMFDWGAREVVDMMENGNFGYKEAKSKIPERPWLVDCLDDWIERAKGPPYHCAAIFADNSGVDIIIGIIPFARELIRRGTKVILCANSEPALNDVTYSELLVILRQVSSICPVIEKAVSQGELIAMETAQAGPCLDLSRLNSELAKQMKHVDLLVIEGMGRAVHTNRDAKFKCDCLKVAVIKNRWLANRLGGQMFSVLCKYEQKSNKQR